MADFAESIRGWGSDDDDAADEYERLLAAYKQAVQERDVVQAQITLTLERYDRDVAELHRELRLLEDDNRRKLFLLNEAERERDEAREMVKDAQDGYRRMTQRAWEERDR